MNVAGGAGGSVGDLPIFISAIKPDSIVAQCRKIQVSHTHTHTHTHIVVVLSVA